MSDESKELSAIASRPNFLSNLPPDAVDNSDLNTYSKPPRIKVVQAMSKPPIKPPFREGDIIVVPQMLKIGDENQMFDFVPIHFFPSWVCLNPLEMTGQLKSIREFSMDPTSDVARNAKSFAKIRCPENAEYYLKYNQTLNFFVVIEGVDGLTDMPIHMFFSRGSYTLGEQFIGEIQLRKAPRYACRFTACTKIVPSKKGNFPGLGIFNAREPWVQDESTYNKYKKLHEDLDKLIKARAVELDLSDPGEEPETTSTEF